MIWYKNISQMKIVPKLGTLFVLVTVLTMAIPASFVFAQNESNTEEEKIIVAYVYNLCKFATWPTELPENLKLAVMKEEGGDIGAFQTLEGKRVNRSTLQVEGLSILSMSGYFHVLYIPETQGHNVDKILDSLGGKPILTISNCDQFCENGGMIRLVERRGRIRLMVNLGAAKEAGININSQVLKLAIKVIQ